MFQRFTERRWRIAVLAWARYGPAIWTPLSTSRRPVGPATSWPRSRTGSSTSPCRAAPGWTVADLVDHVGEVVDFWGAIASGRAPSPDDYERPPNPGPKDLIGWYRELLDATMAELDGVDPATPRWNWTGCDQNAGVDHPPDGQRDRGPLPGTGSRGGAPDPLRQPIALDGVDEFFDVFAPLWAKRLDGPVSTIHLHATDGPGEWVADRRRGALDVERVHAKGDVAVRATASDLVPHALEPGRSRRARAARRPGRARSLPRHREDRLTWRRTVQVRWPSSSA